MALQPEYGSGDLCLHREWLRESAEASQLWMLCRHVEWPAATGGDHAHQECNSIGLQNSTLQEPSGPSSWAERLSLDARGTADHKLAAGSSAQLYLNCPEQRGRLQPASLKRIGDGAQVGQRMAEQVVTDKI